MTPAAATHYVVSGYPGSTVAGITHNVTVTATDAFGNTDTSYVSTVTVTGTATSHVTPSVATALTAGVGTYAVIFDTAGINRTITATGNITTGTQTGITVTPAAATHFSVTGYSSPATAGASDSFDVTALDAFGNTDTNYGGTIHFTTGDTAATLPTDGTLSGGTGSFIATFRTSGTWSIVATDTITASITGSQAGIVVNPTAATHLSVSGFASPITAGLPDTFTVSARDQFENVVPTYAGTVQP